MADCTRAPQLPGVRCVLLLLGTLAELLCLLLGQFDRTVRRLSGLPHQRRLSQLVDYLSSTHAGKTQHKLGSTAARRHTPLSERASL